MPKKYLQYKALLNLHLMMTRFANMNQDALMIQGTASGVGKSVIVAGFCRLLARNGVKVAPFKPQNMSNNAAVTKDGGEIGRAQALQAFACGIEASVDMNPVLIKPESNLQAQLIVCGQVYGRLQAKNFREDRISLLDTVLESFHKLQQHYDFIMVEGAGCLAEPNLRRGDIANMGFAEAADIPVWLLGDIDAGGVFAALKGCMDILAETEQNRIRALLINRFRGHASLLDDALLWLESNTGKTVAGVIPMLHLDLPEEDAPFKHLLKTEKKACFHIAIIAYPHISNHDDFDPFASDKSIQLSFVHSPDELQGCDILILPGSKHVASDLAWLKSEGFVEKIMQHLRYQGKVLGICGGLQMLGRHIENEYCIEGGKHSRGLGLLPINTIMMPEKVLRQVNQDAVCPVKVRVTGYEIHHGLSDADAALFPFAACSPDQQVWGSYVHGLFAQGGFRQAWLRSMGYQSASNIDQDKHTLASLDLLADTLEQELKPQLLLPLLNRG